MSEFTSPNPSPSDDKFDVFLQDLEAERHEVDLEQLKARLDAKFLATINEVGFQPLTQDNERRQTVFDSLFVLAQYSEEHLSVEDIETIALTDLKILAMNEVTILAMIQIAAISPELAIAMDDVDEEKMAASKASLYADVIINFSLNPDDPLLEILNRYVPGPLLNAEDDILQPHYIAAIEKLANAQEEANIHRDLRDEAARFVGINPDDYSNAENQTLLTPISSIIVLAQSSFFLGENAAANREEELRKMARGDGIDDTITEKLIAFVEQRFPL